RASALENVELPLLYGKAPPRKERHERAAAMLKRVGLGDRMHHEPSQLSGGQQQRVAIARAVVLEPPVVLMDEPLSNLDAKLRLEMRTEIRRLHQSLGLTTVYVTHDQEEALSLADRLVVLRDGRVQQVGTPEELHTQPVNWHVADFMGYRNLLPGTAVSVAAGRAEVTCGGLRLAGAAVGPVRAGDNVIVGVRPDDLAVGAGPNAIAAVVEVVEYRGNDVAVEARAGDGTALHLRTTQRLAPGDEVTLISDPARLLVFAAEPDAAPSEPDSAPAAPAEVRS
ncbi:MAG TPA: ABC transporter ATP-binding protein, partial [Mycobacteriales bacterium]|nr:ABC transporter ATP-binding protein [Mycobacteriales bacterium]